MFEPISKEYNVLLALDLSASKNLVYRDNIEVTEPPTHLELKTLRDLNERTKIANSRKDTD